MKNIFSILFLGIAILLSACSTENPTNPNNPNNNQSTYSGKYTGNVLLTSGGNSTQFGMVIDLSNRNSSSELNFLFGNRQAMMILNGNNFTIPRVQGAPSFIVYGNGYFLDSGKLFIDYTEEVQQGITQNFRGTLKKF
jgi:hypothetical protein